MILTLCEVAYKKKFSFHSGLRFCGIVLVRFVTLPTLTVTYGSLVPVLSLPIKPCAQITEHHINIQCQTAIIFLFLTRTDGKVAGSYSVSIRDRLMSAYGLRGWGLVRLIEVLVYLSCCTAGPIVRYRQQWMGCIMRRGTISSYQSAATSKIVKRCCSRVLSWKQDGNYTRLLTSSLLCSSLFAKNGI